MADSSKLLRSYFDDELTDQQFDQLVDWMSEDPANMAEFVR